MAARPTRRLTVPARPFAAAGLVAVVAAVLVLPALAPSPARALALVPVAVNDSVTLRHDRTKSVAAPGVLANDLQLGSGFVAKLVAKPAHGSVTLAGDGGYTVKPAGQFVGTDQFTYRVDGGLLGISNVATVTIHVTNAVPVARADAYSAMPDVEINLPVPGLLGNDTDADGDKLKVQIVTKPSGGNLDAHDDGSFKYKADKDFSGQDTFTYRIWDGVAWSNVVTVTITVGPAPTPKPTASPTPGPTSTPAPTGTPRPTATPPARPTPTPTPRPTPTPTPRPTATPPPSPTPTPIPTGTAAPVPTATPTPSATPSTGPTPTESAPPVGAGVGASAGTGGPGDSGAPTAGGPVASAPIAVVPKADPFVLTAASDPDTIQLDDANVTFGNVEWAVPALVLTVPGLLLIIAVLTQLFAGALLVPVARRWLDGDRRSRRRA